jgi:ABC-2 type transport system ATP-binding protein
MERRESDDEGSMDGMISLIGLTKRFGPISAVSDVSMTVAAGEVLGFLGPNGAGKTTTMRMITGFLPPSDGTVSVCGIDVVDDPIAAQKRMGYLPEGAPLYGDMTPASFLDFIADVRGLAGSAKVASITAAVEKLDIGSVLHRPIDTLSKGYKRRVGLAQAILHDPEVLILDEPTDGLDPNQKMQVRGLIRDMGRDKAIVISTHILEEVEAVCTRAVIIAGGSLVFDGTPAELQHRSERHNAVNVNVEMVMAADAKAAIGAIAGVSRVETAAQMDGLVTLCAISEGGQPILAGINAWVRDKDIPVAELYVEHGRLDDVFHDLTVAR